MTKTSRLSYGVGASFIAATLGAGAANANCTQANLAGSWNAYAVAQSGARLIWDACVLKIDASGKFIAASSACVNSLKESSKAQGQIKLHNSSACTYTGTIHFPSYGVTDAIDSVTLSIDRQTVAGIGGSGAAVFVFNMVKVK